MVEGDHGELAAPDDGYGQAVDQGQEFVAAALAAVETCVGTLPHTVYGVGALWLANDVLETDLDGNRGCIYVNLYLKKKNH